MRRGSLALGGVALIGVGLVIAFGGDLDWDFGWGHGNEATVQRKIDTSVETVRIDSGSSEVSVRATDVDETTVRQSFRYDDARPNDMFTVDGDVLTLGDCDGDCEVDYEVLVPRGVLVDGESGSGDLELTDVGEVDVEVGSADIIARLSEPTDVRIDSGSGDIDLTVPDESYRVTGDSGSGDREIKVGRDGGDHTLDLSTGSGDVIVDAA